CPPTCRSKAPAFGVPLDLKRTLTRRVPPLKGHGARGRCHMARVTGCASVLLAALAMLGTVAARAAAVVPDYVTSAIADPARPPAQIARDARRHPAAVLAV